MSVENEFAVREGIILNSYFFLKKLSLKDESAFGLDKSDVKVEHIPFVYTPISNLNLVRDEN